MTDTEHLNSHHRPRHRLGGTAGRIGAGLVITLGGVGIVTGLASASSGGEPESRGRVAEGEALSGADGATDTTTVAPSTSSPSTTDTSPAVSDDTTIPPDTTAPSTSTPATSPSSTPPTTVDDHGGDRNRTEVEGTEVGDDHGADDADEDHYAHNDNAVSPDNSGHGNATDATRTDDHHSGRDGSGDGSGHDASDDSNGHGSGHG